MAANTAVGAEKKDIRTITFKNKEHRDFYKVNLQKCRYQDVYHKALVYCLGIDRDTRVNVDRIYDFRTGCVKTECLHEGWQTSGSVRIVRMAFNLYCNGTPSVDCTEDAEEQLKECRCYTVEDLFCCDHSAHKYFPPDSLVYFSVLSTSAYTRKYLFVPLFANGSDTDFTSTPS